MPLTFDHLYSSWANRHPFFHEGWGRRDILDDLVKLGAKKVNQNLARRKLSPPRISWTPAREQRGTLVREGVFESPFHYHWKQGRKQRTETLPPEIALSRIQMILPRKRTDEWRPLVIHFSAFGDEHFGRRRHMLAIPLAKQGITSILLENPYYGQRRPPGQEGSRLRTLTEFLQMSRAAQDEALVLLEHFRAAGFGPIGVTGISMGGYVALVTAAQVKFPLAVAACIPCHSAAPVYMDGVLSLAVDWPRLSSELDGRAGGDTRAFMQQVLDLSDLRHLPVPPAASRAVLVGAQRDEYIPQGSLEIVNQHWPGSELRWVSGTHVGSFLYHIKDFRTAIYDSLGKMRDFPGSPLPQARLV